MGPEPTNVEKLRGLPWAIAGNAGNTIFAQFTFFGSAFVLFLSELGLSKSQIGLLLSLFPFFGLVALFVAPAVARFGYRRTFVTFWGLRKLVAAFLLLTPWIVSLFGATETLIYVGGVVATFALCRAIAETGWYPWIQEAIPDSVRGKYAAASQIFTTLTGLIAVTTAGYVVERTTELSGFMILIAAGVLFGLASVWAYSFIPGGAPVPKQAAPRQPLRRMAGALRDRGFLSYLIGFGLVTLATVPMVSFLPLFMQEEVGLSAGQVVLLQNGTLAGALISGYVWGWAADRYGSKPVMLSGVILRLLLPLGWIAIPRASLASLYVALAIALIQGVANAGWMIGSARLLYVSVVPPDEKSAYMALYYAWIGLSGGLSQLLGGAMLDASQSISGHFLVFAIDPYFPLFLLGLLLPLASLAAFRGARADSSVSVSEFAAHFLRGNPFQAMGSLLRYHRAKDEQATVLMTERLSRSRSTLTVNELLDALRDPRFNVRFEAVISIGRMRADPRLVSALVELLDGSELALSVVAAWALGRMGDDRALEPLHKALDSKYRSIQVHSARALGALGDQRAAQMLLSRLASEENKGLRMAFASALGQLQSRDATEPLLQLLYTTTNPGARTELALSLARILGLEHRFVQLLREARSDVGTALSHAVTGLSRSWPKEMGSQSELQELARESAEDFGRQKLDLGTKGLVQVIRILLREPMDEIASLILNDIAARLDEFGISRLEYLYLALNVMGALKSGPRGMDGANPPHTMRSESKP
jgi:MFS family permease